MIIIDMMHHSRKYSPPHYCAVESPLTVPQLNRLPTSRIEEGDLIERSDMNSPKAKSRIRNVKLKAVKAPASPQKPRVSPNSEQSDALPKAAENGARARKRGYKPPDVRTIFEPSAKDPRVKEEKGEGHAFCQDAAHAWCDVCCAYILHGGLTCTGCKYTCHAQCRDQVTLDCHPNGSINGPLSPLAQDHLNNNESSHSDVEKEKEPQAHLTLEEIRQRVEQYNTDSRDHFKMTLNSNGLYTGFIKVQLDLRRPISVKLGGAGGVKDQEAFYLPRGSVNTLHISSASTVRQVIEALLKKFTVADNPAKFTLFKRFSREDHVYTCKLSEKEHPLFLRLVAGPSTDTLSFVLKEQQTGEVMWDAFSIPELHNFLRFLDKEEQDQICSITRRYNSYREKLEEALRATGGRG
ncbi:ras association domain-containing protein 5 isoform X1 [Triplophysa rosa]|uniref:Ras association domain-containing protein 3 n=1 Tax=Triplophysa rosa TaxID=992332 RepID=A0A9W7T8T0_TRIRA|nr:ras association domain-containing protein 5 isoform X1 [Triplophysa rosa]KAI7792126.1 putative ras association domain-containing protein 3 [Triplophysa rosa]